MGIIIDLTGMRFERLVVIRRSFVNKNKKIVWLCKCDCGKEVNVVGGSLRNGQKSCGCAKYEIVSKHNLSRTKEYRVWADMIQRCKNPKSNNYKFYGARGISVCEEWSKSFESFYQNMGLRPSKKHSIERIDVNGNYEPSNCYWATRQIQDNNRTSNRYITYNNTTKSIADWARYLKIHHAALRDYLKRHSFEEAVKWYSLPVRSGRNQNSKPI